MKLLSAILFAGLIAGGCASGAAIDTTTVTDGTGPPITAITTDYEGSWGQAWAPPSDTRSDFEVALLQAGIMTLVPTVPPSGAGGEALSLDARVTTRVPVGGPGVDLIVRRSDLSVFLSLTTVPVTDEPICASRLDDLQYPDWGARPIRGTTGCSMETEPLSYVAWTEDGQNFVAEFATDLGVDPTVAWLTTWQRVA